ncbi:hypothetical protein [Pelagicoccus sp. SDUM812003]|uniref:hypothetical protein n=1 Tax=Pelagicoccus sp. SDUM812003 TaxID=3041267 RepID=UPI00281220F9|nr:hypothetical protein [Pelagicoccus sp. SDUM812003]
MSTGTTDRRRSAFVIALGVQCVLLLASVFVIVSDEAPGEAAVFQGERAVSASAEAPRREQRVRELKRRMSRPKTFQRLAVEAEMRSDLPLAPVLPAGVFDSPIENSDLMRDAVAEMADSGLMEFATGLESGVSSAEFFGVRDQGRRIVIVVNTSASVLGKARQRGVSIERIQDEAASLVEGLEAGTLFGIVQFSQGVRSFSPHLAPAIGGNRTLAADWIRAEMVGNPPIEDDRLLGHEAAFAAALEMRPDLIFFVTDGSLNRRERKVGGGFRYPKISFDALARFVDEALVASGLNPRLHFIGFALGETEREGLTRLASRYGGGLREF